MTHLVQGPGQATPYLDREFNRLRQGTRDAGSLHPRPSAQMTRALADGVTMNTAALDQPLGFKSDEESLPALTARVTTANRLVAPGVGDACLGKPLAESVIPPS